MKKMATVTRRGTRLEQLKNLAQLLAKELDEGSDQKNIPMLSKQYRETIREIEEIEGSLSSDDEISKILQERNADGLASPVR